MENCILVMNGVLFDTISTVEELETVLIRFRTNFDPPNPNFDMVHSNGNVLTLAMSDQGCYLNYVDASKYPPYFSSLGDRTRMDSETVRFRMGPKGQSSHILRRNLVCFEDLLKVAKAFFVSGIRPESLIEWEMD